jgi:hypothetical protein
MESISLQEALRYCLENPDGLSSNELLGRFPQYREELEPLLDLDSRIKSALPVSMPSDRKAAMRQRLRNAAVARRVQDAVSTGRSTEQSERARTPWLQRRLAGALASIVLVALVWWLSATSLPDSIFYPVKLTTENTLLGLSGNPTDLMRGHINLANVRLLDIRTMQGIGKLAQAVPAFDNYDYHLRNCLQLWNEKVDARNSDLAGLLYASSVAGQRVYEGLSAASPAQPPDLQNNLQATVATINDLNTSSSQVLEEAGIDLSQVLRDADSDLTQFLTPGPDARPLPTPTPVAISSPAAEPTLTAVLWSAQTAISEGGTADTPVIAAAETVIAGGTGTPIAQAIQTMLAQPTRISTPSVAPGVTATVRTVMPTVTVMLQPSLTITLPATPLVGPTLPSALPSLTVGAAATVGSLVEQEPAVEVPAPTVAPTPQILQLPR